MGHNRKGLFLAKELKVGNERLDVVFLHDGAARAARGVSVDFSGRLYRYFTMAIRIAAMPELPRFHDHGLRSSFCAPCAIVDVEKTSRRDDARLTEE
jgi:hypothetical protein